MAGIFVQRLAGRSLDDFFITYRYAQNLILGNGFVFNPGERVFGTTAPGMGLLLAAGHLLSRIPIHWLGTLSTGLALLGIALLLLADAEARGRRIEAWLGGTLLLTSTYVWGCHGAEAPVVLLLLLAAARWGGRQPALSGLSAGFAVWCRPDAALGVGLLGLLLWSERRRFPGRFALVAGLVIALGAVAALAYFGDILPNTWTAKRAAEIHLTPDVANAGRSFWPASLPLLRRHLGRGTGLFLVLGLGIVGQWPLFKNSGLPGKLLALYGAGIVIAYPFLGVGFTAWYAIPVLIACLYGVAFAAGAAGRVLASTFGQSPAARWGGGLITACLLGLALSSIWPRGLAWFRGAGHPLHFEGYRQAGLWIRSDSQPGDAIGYLEVGTLAYFSERPVEDLLGLVTPRSIPYVAAGDLEGAFLAKPTRYLVVRPGLEGLMGPITSRRWFRRSYREVARFHPDTSDWTLVYRQKRNPRLPQRSRVPGPQPAR